MFLHVVILLAKVVNSLLGIAHFIDYYPYYVAFLGLHQGILKFFGGKLRLHKNLDDTC